MSSEAALRQAVRSKLAPFGRTERLELLMGEGVPDILWLLTLPGYPTATGLMELKQIDGFPARPDTRVVIPSLTREQADWALSWERGGGTSPLLLQAGSTYCLFAGWQVGYLFLDVPSTTAQVLAAAIVVGRGHFPTAGIIKALVKHENYPACKGRG